MRHRAAKAPARDQDRADRRERRDRPVAATTTEPPAAESRFTNLAFVLEGNARKLAVLSVMSIITAFSETFLIASVVQSISALSAGRDTVDLHLGGASVHAGVNLLLGIAVGAAVVRGVLTALVSVSGPRITGASRARLRRRLLSSYLSTDWATQSADKTGRFLQTLSSAVNDANSIILLLTQALPAAITLVVLLAVATVINPIGTAVLLLVGLVIGVALRPISARAHRAARRDSRGRNAIASHVAGVLTAGAEIAVLGSRPGVLRDGDRLIRTTDRAFGRSQGLKRMVATASQSIAFVIATGGLLLVSSSGLDVNFTTLGTITVLLLRGAGLAQQLQSLTSQWGTTVPYIEQVRTLINLYESHRPSYGTSRFPRQFDITLDGVSYTYPGTLTPAVQVESARFTQGSSTAIIGPSGSGKSTLIQLILRLRDPSQGQVMVGPVTAADISEEELGTRLAYVPQSPTLVPGSIFDNIAFFRSGVTREQVVRAAKLAHIHDEIERMTHGYDTVIDAHVDMLSGGQKQRLALARALTRTPSILVLDEPTSALDSTNEQAVIDTLRQLHGSTTVIMITHKASTVTHCDAVLRLEHGTLRSVAGDGTFGPGLMDALPEGRH